MPPTHDLETLSFWLGMAREAEVIFGDQREFIDLHDKDNAWSRFDLPLVTLDARAVEQIQSEALAAC